MSKLPCGHYCQLEEIKENVPWDHSAHTTNMDADKCSSIRKELKELSPNALFSMALVVFGELFHAVWRLAGGRFCCSVIHIGLEDSENYKFRFTI
jgi:hypothetical protein